MKIDMSPSAITQRLKKTSELRRLCFALGGVRLKEKLLSKESRIVFVNERSVRNDKTNLNHRKTQGKHST